MFERKSNAFIVYIILNIVVFALIFVHAHFTREGAMHAVREKAFLVERLELTDLCLFTDARYTRNPCMADINTPFQDSPLSMEHFPSGTIIQPPRHLGAP
jgi:hypothetical protein